MHLKDLIRLQEAFDKRHEGAKPFYVEIGADNLQELEHLLVCLLGELGEFSNELKKVVRGDVGYGDVRPLLEGELVDVFIYLLKIAGQAGFDLESGFKKKLKENEVRFSRWSKE
jgi:NTP pyrophosphatase (non-canonical NTP hydrolase)